MSKIRILGFLFFLVMAITLLILAVIQKNPHDFQGKCLTCHVGLKDPTILTRDPNHLCTECHEENVKRSHPSDFSPLKPLPRMFPLFKGKMVCVTCHFPHKRMGDVPGNSSSDRLPGPYLLRTEMSGKLFCYTCHRGNFVNAEVDSHALSTKQAHTQLSFEQKTDIDDNSKECLSCHDGTLSPAADTKISGLSWQHKKDIGLSHPINVDYQSVYMQNSRFYRSPQSLDTRIVLVNGKISCITCHNHYSKHKKHLVMDNFRSRLCLACHNL